MTHICINKLSLVQMMTHRLFGAKPLSEPMLAHCQLDHWEQILVKFKSKWNNFHTRKLIWKCRLQNGGRFCLDPNVLIHNVLVIQKRILKRVSLHEGFTCSQCSEPCVDNHQMMNQSRVFSLPRYCDIFNPVIYCPCYSAWYTPYSPTNYSGFLCPDTWVPELTAPFRIRVLIQNGKVHSALARGWSPYQDRVNFGGYPLVKEAKSTPWLRLTSLYRLSQTPCIFNLAF